MNLPTFSRWIALAGALLVASLLFSWQRANRHQTAPAACMAECPAAPEGCERTSVDPGACASSDCKAPLPVCHYAATDAAAVCPPTIVGRCIPAR